MTFLLSVTIIFLFVLLPILSKKVPIIKEHYVLICIIVILLSSLISFAIHSHTSNYKMISNIGEDDIIGTIEGTSSCFTAYFDPSTGAPDYILSTKAGDGYARSLGKVIFESAVNRYAFKVIESTEKKDYYAFISGAIIEDIEGNVGDIIIKDSVDSQFSIFKRSEQINGDHVQTRIIAFASLNCWDEKTYTLTVTDNFGTHEGR